MNQECRNRYNRDNIIFQAGRKVGVFDRVGSHLDGLPVWCRSDSGEAQLDIILYGVHLGGKEWSPPQGVIRDAAGVPSLSWLPEKGEVGKPLAWCDDNEPSKWQRYQHMGDEWWNARERVIGCCEQVGKLFQRQDHDLSSEDIVFLRQIKADYHLMLPSELFECCRRLYPDFFDWLCKW